MNTKMSRGKKGDRHIVSQFVIPTKASGLAARQAGTYLNGSPFTRG